MEEDNTALPPSLPSRIAALVHAQFNALPPRCKPTIREDGSREWVPMSGIVLVKGMSINLFIFGNIGDGPNQSFTSLLAK
jgi:hypothetical protein